MVRNRLVVRRIYSWLAQQLSRLPADRQTGRLPAVISDEFIFSRPPCAMSHASTIAESGGTMVAAWFGGSLESRPDVSILVSRNTGHGWSTPVTVATGRQADGRCYACWNPVLFQPTAGPLLLFYKVGRNPRSWWGMLMSSSDRGASWGMPRRLPDGILGPVKNKPVQLDNGDLLSPSSTEHDGWQVHIERSSDLGENWERTDPINDGRLIATIQPSILIHNDGRLQLLSRTKHHHIAESWSADGGSSWSEKRLTSLPNPNSGTDATSLADGRQLLVYNHSKYRRSPLNIALSRDGHAWEKVLEIAHGIGEYSYPAVIQAADGRVHVTYSWNLSRIRHLVIDPAGL